MQCITLGFENCFEVFVDKFYVEKETFNLQYIVPSHVGEFILKSGEISINSNSFIVDDWEGKRVVDLDALRHVLKNNILSYVCDESNTFWIEDCTEASIDYEIKDGELHIMINQNQKGIDK